jgi:hypothetical protein
LDVSWKYLDRSFVPVMEQHTWWFSTYDKVRVARWPWVVHVKERSCSFSQVYNREITFGTETSVIIKGP